MHIETYVLALNLTRILPSPLLLSHPSTSPYVALVLNHTVALTLTLKLTHTLTLDLTLP